MRLGQIRFESSITAAVFEGELARPVPGYTTVELIRKAVTEGVSLPELAFQMASRHAEAAPPVLPINPVEVWACGCTYGVNDGRRGSEQEIYAQVCGQPRPQIFSSGTSRVCVGPGQPIGIRFDSNLTAPEPGLAVVLGRKGEILGYTLGNDVSAWDIERENPLYLPQSKIYSASCALGPVIVTADELRDPYRLEMTCTISRGGQQHFSGKTSTEGLRRRFEDLVAYLLRANPVPPGSVLLTGTGIAINEETALHPGDTVSIGIPEIGELSNTAAIVQ
ncbi:MAG: fumarylacetoacetate hydrolase family protein [Acidobacteria bacterium]|nr:fumarylacetoacetate hydrolase family protein [Acidobacteriota bacterium]